MAQGLTVTMSKLGVLQSVARAVPLSSTSASVDFVTLNHGLGITPHKVIPTLRSIVSVSSLGNADLIVDSYDMTKIIVRLQTSGAGPVQAQIDVWAEFIHTTVQ